MTINFKWVGNYMFKKYKSYSKKILFKNYFYLIVPSFFLMASKFAVKIILNYFTGKFYWSSRSDFYRLVIFLIFLVLEFIVTPLFIATLLKAIDCLKNNVTDCKEKIIKFISFSNLKKIIAINIPLSLMVTYSDVSNANISAFNFIEINPLLSVLLMILYIIVYYKFFACNYYFALTEATVKTTYKYSFKIMNNIFGKTVLFFISFIGWDLLIVIIYIALKTVITGSAITDLSYLNSAYTPIINSFMLFGFGVNFYLIPYRYLAITYFIDDQLKRIKEK